MAAANKIILGGEMVDLPADILANFKSGDKVIGISSQKKILHIPADQLALANSAVTGAQEAFSDLSNKSAEEINKFFRIFANKLADSITAQEIFAANELDLTRAKEKGRSTTRLELKPEYLQTMIEGLNYWVRMDDQRGHVLNAIAHEGWELEEVKSPYGVVAFIFEGRPNVFADACGVLKMGNTCVLRIGSDALNTARAIMDLALRPALRESNLPENAVVLLDSPEHSAAWALFADDRLGLAVARGTGQVVQMLGEIARTSGNQVSLHGTGGAWMVVDCEVNLDWLESCIYNSLDRKVCNTTNTICVLKENASEVMPKVLAVLQKRGENVGHNYKIHVTSVAKDFIPAELFETTVPMLLSNTETVEAIATEISIENIGEEWEWEKTPEITIHMVDSVSDAVELFNKYSPKFVASLISSNLSKHEEFFQQINAPFVGNGMTRWVDGQYALNQPELGLSNWEFGRLFARSGVLSGASMYTVRLRMRQVNQDLHR